MNSNKIQGILLLLVYVCVATAILNDSFVSPYNLQNVLRSSSMFAIIGIGAIFVIVTGGIDLSIGSLIGLCGCTMTLSIKYLLKHPPEANGQFFFLLIGCELLCVTAALVGYRIFRGVVPFGKGPLTMSLSIAGAAMLILGLVVGQLAPGPWLSVAVGVALSLVLSIHMGVAHGLLITKLNLQPFIVTLIGLMCYRGLARWFADDRTQGFGTDFDDSLRLLAIGLPCTMTFVLLLVSFALIPFGIWRIIRASGNDKIPGLAALLFGIVLCLTASSRYWDGWETNYSEPLTTVAGTELAFFELEIEKDAIQRPAQLMSYSLIPLAFSGLGVLVLVGLRVKPSSSDSMSTPSVRRLHFLLPLILIVKGLGWIIVAKLWIGDDPITITSDTPYVYLKIISVFITMGIIIIGVLWFGRLIGKLQNSWCNFCWWSTCFFAVLFLLSQTSILETKVPTPFFIAAFVALIAGIFLNKTVAGRYLQAMGNNEEATKYSGIDTDKMKITAYVICSFCAGIGAVLFTLNSNNVEPSGHGSFFELYAIAAAVLGGCSLRGGECSIIGVLAGASIIRILYNAPNMLGVKDQLELFTMGIVILIGVSADEVVKRLAARKALRDKRMIAQEKSENQAG